MGTVSEWILVEKLQNAKEKCRDNFECFLAEKVSFARPSRVEIAITVPHRSSKCGIVRRSSARGVRICIGGQNAYSATPLLPRKTRLGVQDDGSGGSILGAFDAAHKKSPSSEVRLQIGAYDCHPLGSGRCRKMGKIECEDTCRNLIFCSPKK